MKRSNVVYQSKALDRYPEVKAAIRKEVLGHNLYYRELDGTGNIWCRDYMPVPTPSGLVKFAYKAGLEAYAAYPQLAVPKSCWGDMYPCRQSSLILDGGGNCTCSENLAVITDVVYRHNPDQSPKQIRAELENELGLDVLIVPREIGDDLGHTDGILKFIDNFAAFVNDYSTRTDPLERAYGESINRLLRSRGIEPIPFPYGYMTEGFPKISEAEFRKKFPQGDDYNPAPGYWINFLWVEGLALVPSFGHDRDDEAVRKIEEYSSDDVLQIDCSDLCQEGGLVNCVSWDCRE